MYNTILVPHGGTEAGDEALKHAIHASKNSNIIILHIVEVLQYHATYALSSSERTNLLKAVEDANQEMRKDMEKKMEKCTLQCKEAKIESKVKVEIVEKTSCAILLIDIENL